MVFPIIYSGVHSCRFVLGFVCHNSGQQLSFSPGFVGLLVLLSPRSDQCWNLYSLVPIDDEAESTWRECGPSCSSVVYGHLRTFLRRTGSSVLHTYFPPLSFDRRPPPYLPSFCFSQVFHTLHLFVFYCLPVSIHAGHYPRFVWLCSCCLAFSIFLRRLRE